MRRYIFQSCLLVLCVGLFALGLSACGRVKGFEAPREHRKYRKATDTSSDQSGARPTQEVEAPEYTIDVQRPPMDDIPTPPEAESSRPSKVEPSEKNAAQRMAESIKAVKVKFSTVDRNGMEVTVKMNNSTIRFEPRRSDVLNMSEEESLDGGYRLQMKCMTRVCRKVWMQLEDVRTQVSIEMRYQRTVEYLKKDVKAFAQSQAQASKDRKLIEDAARYHFPVERHRTQVGAKEIDLLRIERPQVDRSFEIVENALQNNHNVEVDGGAGGEAQSGQSSEPKGEPTKGQSIEGAVNEAPRRSKDYSQTPESQGRVTPERQQESERMESEMTVSQKREDITESEEGPMAQVETYLPEAKTEALEILSEIPLTESNTDIQAPSPRVEPTPVQKPEAKSELQNQMAPQPQIKPERNTQAPPIPQPKPIENLQDEAEPQSQPTPDQDPENPTGLSEEPSDRTDAPEEEDLAEYYLTPDPVEAYGLITDQIFPSGYQVGASYSELMNPTTVSFQIKPIHEQDRFEPSYRIGAIAQAFIDQNIEVYENACNYYVRAVLSLAGYTEGTAARANDFEEVFIENPQGLAEWEAETFKYSQGVQKSRAQLSAHMDDLPEQYSAVYQVIRYGKTKSGRRRAGHVGILTREGGQLYLYDASWHKHGPEKKAVNMEDLIYNFNRNVNIYSMPGLLQHAGVAPNI